MLRATAAIASLPAVALFSKKTEKYTRGPAGLGTSRIDNRENSLNAQFGDMSLSQRFEFDFFLDSSAGDKPDSQTSFHCGLDRLSRIKFHNYSCMFHLNPSRLKRRFDNPPRSRAFFSEDEWSFVELLHLDPLTDPFVVRWNHDNNLIRYERFLANISMKGRTFNDPYCQRSIEDTADDLLRVGSDERQPNLGIRSLELTDQSGKKILCDRGGRSCVRIPFLFAHQSR